MKVANTTETWKRENEIPEAEHRSLLWLLVAGSRPKRQGIIDRERDRKERDLTSAHFETVLASSHGDRFVCGRAES